MLAIGQGKIAEAHRLTLRCRLPRLLQPDYELCFLLLAGMYRDSVARLQLLACKPDLRVPCIQVVPLPLQACDTCCVKRSFRP